MTVTFAELYKDASMWNTVRTFTIDMENPELVFAALGFKKTAYGEYFKRTAYNQAEKAIING